MQDDDIPDDQPRDDDAFLLTTEEDALAELLSKLRHGDFARVLNQLSPEAKDELRSAIGILQGKASFRTEPGP
jgi:hypothetical protein